MSETSSADVLVLQGIPARCWRTQAPVDVVVEVTQTKTPSFEEKEVATAS